MTHTPLHFEVPADPAAPAAIRAQLRRWLVLHEVPAWVLEDLLVASDEICFETILVPGVRVIEVDADFRHDVVHLDFSSDRRRRELRAVPFARGGVEVVDDIGPELRIVHQVTDSVAIHTLPDRTVVEVTKDLRL
jgi:hypothetical protein